MTRLENLYQQKFVLECKDHWTSKDWEYSRKLDAEIRELEPKPIQKEIPTIPEWPKDVVENTGNSLIYHCVEVNSYEEAAAYAKAQGLEKWELRRPLI